MRKPAHFRVLAFVFDPIFEDLPWFVLYRGLSVPLSLVQDFRKRWPAQTAPSLVYHFWRSNLSPFPVFVKGSFVATSMFSGTSPYPIPGGKRGPQKNITYI